VVANPSEEVLAVVELKKGPHRHGAKSNMFTEKYFKGIKIGSKYSKTCKVPGCTKSIDRFPFPSFFSFSFLFFPFLPFFSLSFLSFFPSFPFLSFFSLLSLGHKRHSSTCWRNITRSSKRTWWMLNTVFRLQIQKWR
jgi:hypothetical protein